MIIETYTKIGLNSNAEFEKINNIGMSLSEFKEKLSIEALRTSLCMKNINQKYK